MTPCVFEQTGSVGGTWVYNPNVGQDEWYLSFAPLLSRLKNKILYIITGLIKRENNEKIIAFRYRE